MDTNSLSAAGTASIQASTQSPQIAGKPSTKAAQSSGVQQGTAQQVLESDTGVPLGTSQVTTVNFGGQTLQNATPTTSTPTKHQVNPLFIGLIGLVFVIAIISFVIISKDAKNTT